MSGIPVPMPVGSPDDAVFTTTTSEILTAYQGVYSSGYFNSDQDVFCGVGRGVLCAPAWASPQNGITFLDLGVTTPVISSPSIPSNPITVPVASTPEPVYTLLVFVAVALWALRVWSKPPP